MQASYDVAIIGGGIIGSAIAYYLAKERVSVVVLEEGYVGARATSAAAGMLGAHSEYEEHAKVFFPFACHSQMLYETLQDELYAESGIDFSVRKGGILQLAFSEQERQRLAPMLKQSGVTWLEATQVREREPQVTTNIVGAAHIESDVNVLPQQVCEAFQKAAEANGAVFQEFTKVLRIDKQQTYHLETTAGKVLAERVVVASGAWSTPFFQELGLTNRIVPVKGECLAVKGVLPMLQHTIFHDKCYLMPRNNGELVIGATMLEEDWSEHVSLNGLAALIEKASQLMPNITKYAITSTWSGIRPQTFDALPFIGLHPENEGICFATGHGRNGVLLAPATGELVANLLLQKNVKQEWLEAFRVDRGGCR